MLSPIQLNLILNQEIIERNPQHCHVQKHLELHQHNRYYIHHKSMIVYANLSSLPLDRLMNGQTIKLMRTNLMGSQQITFLYDLIYSYFPYYFKKQTWNEEGIIQFIVSIHSFCVFLENERKEKKIVLIVAVQRHWQLFLEQQQRSFFIFVRWCAFRSSGICCHASFKYKSFSRSFIYHRVNVYIQLQSICLHEFQYSDTK